MPKRPLISATIRTEFGDVLDDPSFRDVSNIRDLVYVPGFSDMRRERDLEIARVATGQVAKHDAKIMPLPVNLCWVRRATPKGAPDGHNPVASANVGYRIVTTADVGKNDWLTAMPPGAVKDADGAISKGDTVLMVCDGKTAARNAARKIALTRAANDAAYVGAAAGGLLSINKPGTEPFVRKET